MTAVVELDGAPFHGNRDAEKRRDQELGGNVLHVDTSEVGKPGLLKKVFDWLGSLKAQKALYLDEWAILRYPNWMRRRGVALVVTLMMSTVLLIMVIAFYCSAKGGLLTSATHRHGVAASYAAEAGLADVMDYLEQNAFTSPPSPFQASLSSGARYRIDFVTATPGVRDSVNNLNAPTDATTFRGPNTLAANSALVVVTGSYGGVDRVLEAVVSRGGGGVPLLNALQAGGTLDMHGDLLVDGIKALNDSTPVGGNIYSNSSSASAALWDQLGSASVSGFVKAVGGVVLGTYSPAGGMQSGAVPAPFPMVNIPATITGKASSPAPVLNPSGVTTLGSGDFYYNGDVVLNGDLVLGDSNLYVTGKLTVDGSVTGKGSVYIGGETSVKGDAVVTADPTLKVALFSQGNVTLSGYDGTAYLDGLGGQETMLWGVAKSAMATINSNVNTKTYDDLKNGGPDAAEHDRLLGVLGRIPSSTPYPENTVLSRIVTLLDGQPDTSKRRFVQAKLNSLADFFSYGSQFGGDPICLANYASSGGKDVSGLMDSALDDTSQGALWPALVNLTNSINLQKLGAAQFRGLVYTRGNLRVESELNVLGGVLAAGNISLLNGSKVTYVEDFNTPGSFGSPGNSLFVETSLAR